MPAFDAVSFLKTVTTCPGVYQMLDKHSQILYVGKANNLKKRLSSYFQKTPSTQKIASLVQQIARIEVIVTATENEALLLENNLIKQHLPRYNVLLRDDKSYPYLVVSNHADYPRIDFYRGPRQTKGKYFGPYPSAKIVRENLALLQKIFRIRQCEDSFFQNRTRPCLQYQIQRCTAPCVGLVTPAQYQQQVRHAILFLEGKNQEIIGELAQRMEVAAAQLQFELAAHYRDQIANLRQLQEKQQIIGSFGDIDVVAIVSQQDLFCISVLYIRNGEMLGNKTFWPKASAISTLTEVLSAFLTQYYLNSALGEQKVPKLVLINHELADQAWISAALSQAKQQQVTISCPQRGQRLQWAQMAAQTAQQALVSHLSSKMTLYQRFEALQTVLGLASKPQRLECFDISHTQGEATVASCVVFSQQGAIKQAYRRFNITGIAPGDDYAALKQALTRRYARLKLGEDKLPDILFIDGGKGQLKQACIVMAELQISGVILVGVAKGEGRKPGLETLFIGATARAVKLAPSSPALHLIQQIRDEAHRFAITAHRSRRGKARLVSALENIVGVGPKRRRLLLQQFGGLQQVKRASVAELASVPGISLELAERIYAALRRA